MDLVVVDENSTSKRYTKNYTVKVDINYLCP